MTTKTTMKAGRDGRKASARGLGRGLLYLGEIMPPAAANPAFDDLEVMAQYQAGQEVCVYAGACTGLYGISNRMVPKESLQRPWQRPSWSKVGVTAVDLRHRLVQIGRDRYGAGHMAEDGPACGTGFGEWWAQPIHVTMALSQGSPVRPSNRGLRVTLPATMTVRAFDLQLAAALDVVAMDKVMAGPVGKAICHPLGLDPRFFMRTTAYDFGGATRHSRAREIVLFRPRLDGDFLVAVVEAILVAHLVLLRAGGGAGIALKAA